MPESTAAGIITAFGTVLTALALVITAVGGYIRSKKVEAKVDEVHVIVNQQRTDAQRYQRALIAALRAHDVEVPVDQSIETEDDPPKK